MRAHTGVYRIIGVGLDEGFVTLHAVPFAPETEPVEDARITTLKREMRASGLADERLTALLPEIIGVMREHDLKKPQPSVTIKLALEQYKALGEPTVGKVLKLELRVGTEEELDAGFRSSL